MPYTEQYNDYYRGCCFPCRLCCEKPCEIVKDAKENHVQMVTSVTSLSPEPVSPPPASVNTLNVHESSGQPSINTVESTQVTELSGTGFDQISVAE